jgi:hypothetical protein
MTIDTTSPIVSLTGDNVTTQFSFPFVVSDASHIQVTIQDRSVTPYVDSVVISTSYTVDLTNKRVTYPITGTPLRANQAIIIERIVPLEQTTDLRNQSGFFAEDFEDSLDYLTMMVQQLDAKVKRAMIAPVGSSLDLDAFLTEYNDATDRINDAIAQLAVAFFTDVFTASGTTFTLTQTHNGRLLRSSPPTAGQLVTLPLTASLQLPYQICVKKQGGTGTMTAVPSGTDTIDGLTSVAISTTGEWIFLVADGSGATAGDWTVVRNSNVGSASVADASVTTAKLADLAVTAAKIAAGTITLSKITNQTASSLLGVAGATDATLAPIVISENSFPARATGGTLKPFTFGAGFTVNDGTSTVSVAGGGGTPDDNSVSTVKIQNNAVTNAKLATDAVAQANIADNAVGTAEVINSAITYAKIQNVAAYNIVCNPTASSTAPSGLALANNSIVAKGTGNVKSFALTGFTFDDTGNGITYADAGVTLPKIATQAATSIVGNPTAGTASPTAIPLANNTVPAKKAGLLRAFTLDNGFQMYDDATSKFLIMPDIPLIGGRLTVSSTLPVPDVQATDPIGYDDGGTGTATLYYLPFEHNKITLYDDTISLWRVCTFTSVSMSISTASAGTMYDVFAEFNGTTSGFTMVFVAWQTTTTRGTGSPLALQDGIWVSSGNPKRRYLGSFYCSVAGTCLDNKRQRHSWNFYNRVSRPLAVWDTTATNSWTYTPATGGTWRVSNNVGATNRIEVCRGFDDEAINATFSQDVKSGSTSANVGIGIGRSATVNDVNIMTSLSTLQVPLTVSYHGKMGLGYRVLYMQEYNSVNTSAGTFYIWPTADTGYGGVPFAGMTANVRC